MFRFPKTLDPITLFHNPKLPASIRALEILQRASETATSASIPSSTDTPANTALHNPTSTRGEFQLDVTTSLPTSDQLRSILEYLSSGSGAGGGKIVLPREVVPGAEDVKDAVRRYSAGLGGNGGGEGGIVRPITVDWINGKAVIGDNESEILRMVRQLPNEQ